ncbi:MAG: flavin reductase family protein [Actinocrinis sp.]
MVWRAAPGPNGDGIAEVAAYGAAYGDTYIDTTDVGDFSPWDTSRSDVRYRDDRYRDDVQGDEFYADGYGQSPSAVSAMSGRHARPNAGHSPDPVPGQRDERAASAEFRSVMGNFATGVTVITTLDGPTPVGFTCQTFTSLSLDPPLISFAATRESASRARILSTGRFCVNILAYDQRGLCAKFAASGVDRFQGTPWRLSPNGSPVIGGSVAWIDCAVEAEYPAGDHTIVLGRVHDLAIMREAAPLVFHRGQFANCFAAPGGDSLSRAS